LGNASAANLVALGIIVKKTGAVSEASVVKVIEEKFSAKPLLAELNIKAFRKGLEA
jgi:Pyruvate/2-oxoacid:ferredoxin oxidoreductase gamma subunit